MEEVLFFVLEWLGGKRVSDHGRVTRPRYFALRVRQAGKIE